MTSSALLALVSDVHVLRLPDHHDLSSLRTRKDTSCPAPTAQPAHPPLERFVEYLNTQPTPPAWAQAATQGVELVDVGIERRAAAETAAIATLERIRELQQRVVEQRDQLVANGELDTVDAEIRTLTGDLAAAQTRGLELVDQPGRYYLATGEVVEHHPDGATHTGSWTTEHHDLITTPAGSRIHGPGIGPDTDIHPTADIDPTARIETGAGIGAGARIGHYTHVGRDAVIGPNVVVQDGASVGPLAEVWNRTWICEGAYIGARSVIGNAVTIGNGTHVAARSEIPPHSRIGPNSQLSAGPSRDNGYRNMQLASAVERLMSYDRE